MKKMKILFVTMIAACALVACSQTDSKQVNSTQGSRETSALPSGAKETFAMEPDETMELVSVYRAGSDAETLERVLTYVEVLDEQALVDKLVEFGVLDEGIEVLSFEIVGGTRMGPGMAENEAVDEGDRIGYLDLSKAPTVSSAEDEKVILNALSATFEDNYELDKVKLTVNGENYQSEYTSQGDEDYLTLELRYTNVFETEE